MYMMYIIDMQNKSAKLKLWSLIPLFLTSVKMRSNSMESSKTSAKLV